ncbi:MAG: hypothetical protein U9Q12_01715 [Patescibacteria group bacterium]|nr:hypothetical protein [Patescibacteria group bacterium]
MNLVLVGLLGIALTACCCPESAETVYAPQPQPPAQFAVVSDCGESFPAFDWLDGNVFAYEILDKRCDNQGFKVKVLEHQDGFMVHRDCARNLSSTSAAYDWLRQKGYTFYTYKTENSPDTDIVGRYKAVDRGILLRR